MTSAGAHPAPPFFSSDIVLKRLLRADDEGFRLHGRGKPAWDLPTVPIPEWHAALAPEENDHLLALLADLVVPYAVPRGAGLDGTWHILEMSAGAHTIRLEWWVDPPPAWAQAGALYDYAVSLARRTYLAWLKAD